MPKKLLNRSWRFYADDVTRVKLLAEEEGIPSQEWLREFLHQMLKAKAPIKRVVR